MGFTLAFVRNTGLVRLAVPIASTPDGTHATYAGLIWKALGMSGTRQHARSVYTLFPVRTVTGVAASH